MKQTIGEFLSTLRKAKGYTQQEVADKLDISNKTLSNWECDKALPDILLLPALAEIYGVTVDEIVSGERKSQAIKISEKAEKSVYRSKLAKFSLRAWILTGLGIIGLFAAFFAGCSVLTDALDFGDAAMVYMLTCGIVVAAICFGLLFIFWNNAEMSADDSGEIYPRYCLVLRKKLVTCLYVVVAWTFVQALIAFYIANFDRADGMYVDRVAIVCACFVFPVLLYVAGAILYNRALAKFDKGMQSLRADKKFVSAVAIFGLMPVAIVAIVSVVLACVRSLPFDYLYVVYVDVALLAVDVAVCLGLCVRRRFAHCSRL